MIDINASMERARGSQEAGCRTSGVEFAPDSPLEGDGFELSVPRVMEVDLGRQLPALIAVFELAGTAVTSQRGTKCQRRTV